MWSSSTICKCLVLLVALRGRAAEWQWAETGGATLCGNSDTVSVGHMLRYSNLILNLNFPPLGQVFTIFFSCPVLLFIFYHLHYFIISVFILYFLGVYSSHPLRVCVCSFGHFLFYSAVSFLMCPVGLLLVFTHCCDLLLFPNCFHQLGSTCVFSHCLTSVLSVCSAPMFFPYVLHSMPSSTFVICKVFVHIFCIFDFFLIMFHSLFVICISSLLLSSRQGSISTRDASRINKLIHKAGTITGKN